MFGKIWWWLTDQLHIQAHRHRKTLVWWWVCLAAGVVLAIISLAVGSIESADINTAWVDANLINMTAVSPGIGAFIWQRWLSILLPLGLVLLCGLGGGWTRWLVVPILVLRGYWLCLTLWWAYAYYTWHALFLLLFYLGWLVLTTTIFLAGVDWALDLAAAVRAAGRCAKPWGQFWRGFLVLSVVAVVLGVLEYLVFFAFLGRIVYKPL